MNKKINLSCMVLLFLLVNLNNDSVIFAQNNPPLPRVAKYGSTPYTGHIETQIGHSTWCAFCSLSMLSNGRYSSCFLAGEYAKMFHDAPYNVNCCFTTDMSNYKYCDGGVRLNDLGEFSGFMGLGWPSQWVGVAAFCNMNGLSAEFPRLGLIHASSVHCVLVFCIMRYLMSDNIHAEHFIYYIDPENGLPWTDKGSVFIGN